MNRHCFIALLHLFEHLLIFCYEFYEKREHRYLFLKYPSYQVPLQNLNLAQSLTLKARTQTPGYELVYSLW